MTRVVESDHGAAVAVGPGIQRLGLGAAHVGFEAAKPEQTRRDAGSCADGNRPRFGTGSQTQGFQARIAHWGLIGGPIASGLPADGCFAAGSRRKQAWSIRTES